MMYITSSPRKKNSKPPVNCPPSPSPWIGQEIPVWPQCSPSALPQVLTIEETAAKLLLTSCYPDQVVLELLEKQRASRLNAQEVFIATGTK